ncbi:MAG: prephenate dehydrogenase, partial [Paenibacillus sp. RIFOXYA1_FULL_44_5]
MKIAIFGVGLIGGSLALCFKNKPDITVAGHEIDPLKAENLLKRQVVDEASTSMEETARNADFIFLCVPVGCLEDYLLKLTQMPIKPGCVITDVGSTKASITRYAKSIELGGAYFIGGHPMAGKEQSGVEAASSHLFENAYYVLTPDEHIPEAIFNQLEQILQATKASIVRMDAQQHDQTVGAISHLPHILAASLVNLVEGYHQKNPLYGQLAAGGFHDITRIASSNPLIWRDILLHNKDVILTLLQDWSEQVAFFQTYLEQSDGEQLAKQFEKAKMFRSRLPERRKGVLSAWYDIYVDIPDHPGIIGQIT